MELNKLIKIRGEFLTQKDANLALENINLYCQNARISNNYINNDYYDYVPDYGGYYMSDPSVLNFGGFGSFGMIGGGWNFGNSVLDGSYNRTLPHSHLDYNGSESRRATLEANVSDDNAEYVRNKLYSLGAISAT